MKPFKPTCVWIKKEQAAQKRAMFAYQRVVSPGEAAWRTPFNMNEKLASVIYLYASALGQKRGQLPANLSKWSASGAGNGINDNGEAAIVFAKPGTKQVIVNLKNLNAWPAPAVDESGPDWSEPMKVAA